MANLGPDLLILSVLDPDKNFFSSDTDPEPDPQIRILLRWYNSKHDVGFMYAYCICSHHRTSTGTISSVAEPEPPGAATFSAEPEPIFFWVGAGSRSPSRLF